MHREGLYSFLQTAEAGLVSARGSLLLVAQLGAGIDLAPFAAQTGNIADIALELGLETLAERAIECSNAIAEVDGSSDKALKALDAIAATEAELLRSRHAAEPIADVPDFIDQAFKDIVDDRIASADSVPDFAIDAETLEIFRSEGEELLGAISLALDVLAASPADQNALWDIRRAAHTFKGAAGIVGLTEAASLAHRMEDLLDGLVESGAKASGESIDFFRGCVRSLGGILDGAPANAAGLDLAYAGAVASLKSSEPTRRYDARSNACDSPKHNPTVRVSLERLNEILRLSEDLLTQRITANGLKDIAAEIHERLLGIRLVRFGTLETRLHRAVSITATEEAKRAILEIETPDAEIDTLILDSLVEPLLHLVKNAVVHGIESPESRRMIGKHEFGLVTIHVEADAEAVVVTVSDDGAGIDLDKLKHRAVQRELISSADAAAMTARDACKLIFNKGLSTADQINLNAGRGVGMSIVQEAVESRGGSVHVESRPQLGTSFTLMLPVETRTRAPQPTPRSYEDLDQQTVPLVLVVDDSPTIRRQTQRLIENAGLRCVTANDGADALELLLNGSVEPDLVLSDVEMPNIDGWSLLEYIKTDDHLGDLPVVIVTSLDDDKYRATATKLGAEDYIVKPLRESDLERVSSLLNVSV